MFLTLRDSSHPYDESAALAGLIKNLHEGVEDQVTRIARLTAVTVPQEERRARILLDSLIDAKRAFMNQEAKREGHGVSHQ